MNASPSHGENRGSSPLGSATQKIEDIYKISARVFRTKFPTPISHTTVVRIVHNFGKGRRVFNPLRQQDKISGLARPKLAAISPDSTAPRIHNYFVPIVRVAIGGKADMTFCTANVCL